MKAALMSTGIVCLAMSAGCDFPELEPLDPLDRPDPAMQVERLAMIRAFQDRGVLGDVQQATGSRVKVAVGPAWRGLGYADKRGLASVVAAWGLSRNWEDQTSYIVRFVDGQTDKQVAVYHVSSALGESFDVSQ